MKLWEKVLVVVAMTLLIVVALAVVFGGIFLGLTGFFSLIGVTYESNGSLLLFLFYCFLVGIFFEIIEQIILLFIKKANLRSKEKWIWIALIKLVLTWVVIHTVNELMTTVVLSSFAEFLTALLIVSIDIVFDDDE
ncbi:YrvL family regulatory protein [Bacillus piscicola]|uniref:YrvL family regulatory protein n=1 Tax=Bacillus piscicola TaxID=1632684 RepID=UPI001F09AA3C|nr:YrvL family regulatory protein [Bacillus piscicola]